MSEGRSAPSRTVIVCAYTLDRLALTVRCLDSVLAQDPAPDQVLAIVDHNEDLGRQLAGRFPTVDVRPNTGPRGLSGARNTGIDAATGDLISFIDDDATPDPGWLAGLTRAFDDPTVAVAGGAAIADWEVAQPSWFPDEYLWVVGCSYRGQVVSGDVRNPLGCNMAFRRTVFEAVGRFHPAVGRLGTLPIGAEETELCLRARSEIAGARVLMVDGAVVHHFVGRDRGRLSYFVRRCFYEGISKAVLRDLAVGDALATERSYVLRTLTSAAGRRLVQAVRLDRPVGAIAGIGALGLGVVSATVGYAYGRIRTRRRGRGDAATGATAIDATPAGTTGAAASGAIPPDSRTSLT